MHSRTAVHEAADDRRLAVCCLFLLIFGIVTAWQAAAGLPRTYSRLDIHGVHATATFGGCRVTSVRHHECRLTLVFGGRTRTWTYPEDYPQSNGLAVGAPVDVLVDFQPLGDRVHRA